MTQAKAAVCRTRGWDEDRIASELWLPQHQRAGERMYRLCIDLRGFYLKVLYPGTTLQVTDSVSTSVHCCYESHHCVALLIRVLAVCDVGADREALQPAAMQLLT